AKQVAKPSGQLSGPPKIDNDDDIVAASSETKLSKMIAVEARNACAIMDRPAARPGGQPVVSTGWVAQPLLTLILPEDDRFIKGAARQKAGSASSRRFWLLGGIFQG